MRSPESTSPRVAPSKWRNPHRRIGAVRWAVQIAYALFLALVGVEFFAFFGQALGSGPMTAARPPAVEAFLPISALVGLRVFLATGRWDAVHPAGLAILCGALAASLLARKSFCAWVCPAGTLSRALEWVGERTLYRRRRAEALLPRWLDAILTAPKYLLLAFFASTIFLSMDAASAQDFLRTPYNAAADAKMLLFFRELSTTAAVVLASLAALSVAVKNAWCRFLCPYGALLGVVGALSPQRVVRDAATCIDCKRCTKACPAEIRVHAKGSVLSPECIGCLDCVAACPVKDCMTVGRRAGRGWSPYLVPALGVGAMLVAWIAARATGHWESAVPVEALRAIYRHAQDLSH